MREKQKLDEIVKRLTYNFSPEKIILFGSRSRGDAMPESDYDLLIIEETDLPRYKRAAKYRRVLKDIGVAKDIVVWTPEEIMEWQNVPNAFITTALEEGVIVYEG